jgi:hypothetical protein
LTKHIVEEHIKAEQELEKLRETIQSFSKGNRQREEAGTEQDDR